MNDREKEKRDLEKFFAVLEVIMPIFVVVGLGAYARRKAVLSSEQVQGLQIFVMKFCLPCVLFNSCLSASVEMQSLTAMFCVIVTLLCSVAFCFKLKKKYPYHNMPMLFGAQESGMLGIPLYMTLFGVDNMFRMGVMDVAQSLVGIPIIVLLSSDVGESASVSKIVKSVLTSPLLLASLCGLFLNLTGIYSVMNVIGCGQVLKETTSFLVQPVSAAMLFSVGYNFSLEGEDRKSIINLSILHLLFFLIFGAIALMLLTLTASAEPYTIWAAVLYFTLPASYLAPSLGRKEEEAVVASGVCSILTMFSLIVFCIVAVITS